MVPVIDRLDLPGRWASSLASTATGLWQFALAQGLLIGLLGSSATFAPLVADTSLWFERRRGIAVAICASGNYLGGRALAADRAALRRHRRLAADLRRASASFCVADDAAAGARAATAPAALARRAVAAPRPVPSACRPRPRRPGAGDAARHQLAAPSRADRPLGLSPALQALLCVAGVACCVAMSMPQVHIVAYCGDLGYGAARGAQMLSLMLGFGIVSRLVSGLDLRPHRRAAHPAARLGAADARARCCSCPSTAWRRST